MRPVGTKSWSRFVFARQPIHACFFVAVVTTCTPAVTHSPCSIVLQGRGIPREPLGLYCAFFPFFNAHGPSPVRYILT